MSRALSFGTLFTVLLVGPGPLVRGEDVPAPDVFSLPLEALLELDVAVEVASGFAEEDRDVGSSVALITRSDWRKRGARDVKDALGHLPGTILLPDLFGGRRLTIRGFAAGRQLSGTSALLDGIPINSLDTGTALFEINGLQLGVLDRMEMVRGPGSAIYGADAFQGVLALHTFAADPDVIELDSEVGSDSYYQGAVRMSQPVGNFARAHTAFAYSTLGDQDQAFRFTDPATGEAGYGAFGNRIESMMGVFKLESSDDEAVMGARMGVVVNEQHSSDFPGLGSFPFDGASALKEQDLSSGDSEFAMINAALIRRFPRDVEMEIGGYYWQAARIRDFYAAPGVAARAVNDADRMGLSMEIKQPDNDWNTQWLLAYEYDVSEVDKHRVSTRRDGESVTRTGGQEGISRTNHGVVMQAKTQFLGDRVHALYGGRVDDFSDFGTQTTPRLGLIVEPSQASTVKLLYGHAFRPASAGEMAGTAAVPGNPDLDAETIDTVELVGMYRQQQWRASLTLFASEWNDAIVTTAEGRTNGGENEAYGAEAECQWMLGNLSLDLNGSFVESEDTINDVDYAAFPRFILNPGLGYAMPALNLNLYLVNRIHLDADAGPTTAAVADPPELKDYWRTDLTLTWHSPDKPIEIYASLLNLFDRDNYLPSINNAEGGYPDIDFTASAGLRMWF